MSKNFSLLSANSTSGRSYISHMIFAASIGEPPPVLAGEEVLDGLVLEEAAPGLLDGELRQVPVRAQRGERGLLDDVVDLLLVEGLEPGERPEGVPHQSVHPLLGLHGRHSFFGSLCL
ncbi:hypothetical protein [Streptomyces sp. LMG1-1-1.1]|uniref:hypothetical protein n=1 Tax=Streptomyces sp. LMG1-1-1.1 TaxID=3135245 RepID=UPI003466CEB0